LEVLQLKVVTRTESWFEKHLVAKVLGCEKEAQNNNHKKEKRGKTTG